MKVTLTLKNPLWDREKRRAILDKAVQESGAELEAAIKTTIDDSIPAGRLYGKGSITRTTTKPLLALGLKTRRGSPNRIIVGSRIHRASAPGQPPARDKSNLWNSIRAKNSGLMKSTVAVGTKYAAALDRGTATAGRNHNVVIKPRPFFASTVEKFRPKFKENIQKAIAENS